MLLLLPAVVLLGSLTVANPTHPKLNTNLKNIIDNAERYNESFTKEFFVEDVSHLAEGENRCQDAFFCKVKKILADHKNLTVRNDVAIVRLVKNLEEYIKGKNKNCPELLKGVTSTGVSKPIPDLVGYLIKCIKSRNLNN